jgi:glycosyltransferase involved in cell wall biosynthesis
MSVDIAGHSMRAESVETFQAADQPKVMYVINSFNGGGAEAGLVTLVRGGLFENCRLQIVALARGDAGHEAQLRALGYEPKILLDAVRMRTRDLPRIFRQLWQLIACESPQIVIAALPQANLFSRLCVMFKSRICFISFEHNTHLAKWIYEVGYRLTSFRVNWTFGDAANSIDSAVRRLYRQPPVRRDVVPLVSFERPAQYPRARAAAPFRLVNAARFTTVKNQAALVRAAAILRGKMTDVELILYGEGPERAACEDLARQLGIGAHVSFPGFVPDWSLRRADLFVLSSYHEGLCIVVLQAMHAGIPVVAPNIGGLQDYAGPDLMAVLPAVNSEAIAQTVADVLTDPAGAARRAGVAADMVMRRFGREAVSRRYAAINRDLIEQGQVCALRGARS